MTERYVDNGDGTLTDSATDLMWQEGYPWTNTLEDRHTFLEGSLASLDENASGFFEIHMDVDPIHSGRSFSTALFRVIVLTFLAL